MQNPYLENRNRNSSTQSNFTFGVPRSLHQNTIQGQFLDQENSSPPRFLNQNHLRSYEASYIAQDVSGEARSLLDKLDRNMYSCYKYWIIVSVIFEGFFMFIFLVSLLSNINEKRNYFELLLSCLRAYSFWLEYQAIDKKNQQHADKAVKMMQLYMILKALISTSVLITELDQEMNELPKSSTSILFGLILTILVVVISFYFFYLFGANKVKSTLDKAYALLREANERNIPLIGSTVRV